MKRGRPKGRSLFEDRLCKDCGSKTTFLDKYGSFHWYHFQGGFLCEKCNNRLVKNPKFHPISNPKRFKFRERIVQAEENPRIGVCNLCRNVAPFDCKLTHIHHEEYHDEDPMKDTIEICPRCHMKTRIASL